VRKVYAVGLAGLALLVAACVPNKPPPPPPPPPNVDVLLVGDSVGFGIGCGVLGHAGDQPQQTCPPPPPGLATYNGYLGACSVSQGTLLLYDKTAVQGSCNDANTDYSVIWPSAVNALDPELVVIVTGGWEIVDRWEDPFPAGGACSTSATESCGATNHQWGSTTQALEDSAASNYQDEMTNAINLMRGTTSAPEILLLNAPYVDPQMPNNGVWYEPWVANPQPPDYVAYDTPNNATPFKPSKDKVEALNLSVQGVVDSFAVPEVQMFNFWELFAPFDTDGGQRVFSMYLCAANFAAPLDTCPNPVDQLVVRDADRGHFSTAGYVNVLKPPLLAKITEMLTT
jgi:hypothetical protein